MCAEKQCYLIFEKKRVTYDSCFHLYTTIIGMTLVDCWKIEKKCSITQNKFMTLFKCVDQLGQEDRYSCNNGRIKEKENM